MRNFKLSHAVATLALAVPFMASANPNLITNGSFEADVQANGTWNIYSNLSGWTGHSNIELRNNVAGVAYDGVNFVEMDSDGNNSMSQSFATILGQSYVVSFAYSPRETIPSTSNGIEVFWNNNSVGLFTGTGSASGNTWGVETFNVIGAGTLGTLTFSAVGTSDSLGGSLDNVSVTAVPEPETYALMLAGLGVMGFMARRRKAATAQR